MDLELLNNNEFVDKYKKCELDYDFEGKCFCGFRGIVLSEKKIKEKQKLNYSILVEDIKKEDINYSTGLYIDIDDFNLLLDGYSDRYKKIITMFYGLEGKRYTLEKIGKQFNVTREAIRQQKDKFLRQVRENDKIQLFLHNINDQKEQYEDIQNSINDLKLLISYIADENGNPKNEKDIENVKLINTYVKYKDGTVKLIQEVDDSDFAEGLIEEMFNDGIGLRRSLMSSIINKENYFETIKDLNTLLSNMNYVFYSEDLTKEEVIDDLNLTLRSYNYLRRAGIYSIYELVQNSQNDLLNIRNFGRKTLNEVVNKLNKKGFRLRNEDEVENIQGLKRVKRKSNVEILLNKCNSILSQYEEKIEQLGNKILRYNMAKYNYLLKENIFSPEEIVPNVPRNLEIDFVADELENPSISKSNNEDLVEESAEDLEKEELIKDIRENQEKLKKIFVKEKKDTLLNASEKGKK